MTPALDIRIDTPPKGKGRPRFVRSTGRTYTPAGTRAFESAVKRAARKAWDGDPIEGPAVIAVTAVFRRPAKPKRGHPSTAQEGRHPFAMGGSYPDASNVLKAVEDAINGVVWVDDRQVWRASCERLWAADGEGSCVEVRVWAMEGSDVP